jgi:hypothetical protein
MRICQKTATTFTVMAVIVVALCACGSDSTSANSGPPVNVAVTGTASGNGSSESVPAGNGASAGSGSPAASAAVDSSPAPSTGSASQTSDDQSQQNAPFDFELTQGFTSFSPPGDQAAATEEENAFKHVLFEIDPGGTSYVIDGNLSPTPVPATVSPASGGLNIAYYEQVGGAASTSIQFGGVLSNDGTLNARAIVDQAGGTVAEGTEYLGASTGTYYFTGPADKVSPDDLPYPPVGGGQCGWTSDFGISLTWGAPSNGPAPSAYDIYEFVAEANPPLFYLGRVNTAALTDNSGTTRGNDASIISYTVYSVGPTGIDSPSGITITVSGVMPGSPPSCSVS